MKILDRYILRFHLAPFLFGAFLVVFLFLFQLLMRELDKLVGKGLSFWVIAHLIVLNLSWMVVLAVPIGILFSTLMTFGNLSSTFEITAMKSGGYSFLRLLLPVGITSLLAFALLFWFNDYVLPESNHKAKVLMIDINQKKPTFSLESGQFSSQIENYTILARKVDSLSNGLRGITIYDQSSMPQFNSISADSGYIIYIPKLNKMRFWLFQGEILQMLAFEPQNLKIIRFDTLELLFEARGFNLERSNEAMIARSDREMRIRDMKEIVLESRKMIENSEKLIMSHLTRPVHLIPKDSTLFDSSLVQMLKRDATYLENQISSEIFKINDYDTRARQFEVEIHKKYAIPFACIVFALIGCPLGMITKRGNFGISAGISLAFYIFYWACLIGGEKLADRGYISPFISMWFGNFVILLLSIILIFKVNNESFSLQKFANHFRKKAVN
ncbi:MAG: LptF/LptG family permease [Candidatus Kapaibacteriales bacterium]